MDNWEYLVAAYSIVWIAIFGYLFSLSRKQSQLWREIDTLKEKIKDRLEN